MNLVMLGVCAKPDFPYVVVVAAWDDLNADQSIPDLPVSTSFALAPGGNVVTTFSTIGSDGRTTTFTETLGMQTLTFRTSNQIT